VDFSKPANLNHARVNRVVTILVLLLFLSVLGFIFYKNIFVPKEDASPTAENLLFVREATAQNC